MRVISHMSRALLAAAAVLLAAPIAAEDEQLDDKRFMELISLIYDFSLLENCGLVSYVTYDGYRRRLSHLQARDRVDKARLSRARIAAWVAFDLEYLDRGLGGQRGWCRNEGVAAAQDLIDFRNARIALQSRTRH